MLLQSQTNWKKMSQDDYISLVDSAVLIKDFLLKFFAVNGELLTDKNKICDMWADHFESLGSPSEIETFDKDFNKVSDSVRESLAEEL